MTNCTFFIISTLFFASLGNVIDTKQIITVFIHGTMHEAIRLHPCLYRSDLLLDIGLTPVDLENWKDKTEPTVEDCYAAFHIVNAFDACVKHTTVNNGHRRYYTFGWSGALSERARKKASVELYDALTKEYERLHAIDPNVEVELYGHSHGNQLILYLATIRNEHLDHAWLVDRAVLSAAPLHYDMARHAFHPMFKTLINIYSEGDMVQTLDFISVPHGACKRSFRDLHQLEPYFTINKNKSIIDIRIGAYSHYNFFGHGTFFTLDRYTPHPTLSRRLRHKYHDLITALNPLPLVSLYPLILPYCNKQGYQSLSANIVYYNDKIEVLLTENNSVETTYTIAVPTDFMVAQDYTKKKYKHIGYTSELGKLCQTCICSIQQLFKKKPKLG